MFQYPELNFLCALLLCTLLCAESKNIDPQAPDIFLRGCGRPLVDPSKPQQQHTRIVGGHNAREKAWPFIASLFALMDPKTDSHKRSCGASIINREWLVTAAHCLAGIDPVTGQIFRHNPARLRVSVGNNNLTDVMTRSRFRSGTHPVWRTFVHKDYYHTEYEYQYDIGLIQLALPLKFSDSVQPICMPTLSPEEMYSRNNGQLTALMAGWGNTKWNNGYPTDSPLYVTHFKQGESLSLLQISVHVIPSQECERPYYEICALDETGGRSPCVGDSGGPVILKADNGQWQMYGIISNLHGCGISGEETKLANVYEMKQWIENTIINS